MKKYLILSLLVFLLAPALILAAPADEAQAAIDEAEQAIVIMSKAGFSVTEINETFRKANLAYSEGSYQKSIQLSTQVLFTKQSAFETFDIINQAKEFIYDESKKGLDVTDANEVLALADSSFEGGEYAEALRLAQEAVVLQNPPLRARFVAFIRTNWKQVLIALAILSVIAFLTYKPILNKYDLIKFKALEKEEQEIDKLILETDNKYYKDKILSSSEYHHIRKGHEEKMAKIRHQMAALKAKKR